MTIHKFESSKHWHIETLELWISFFQWKGSPHPTTFRLPPLHQPSVLVGRKCFRPRLVMKKKWWNWLDRTHVNTQSDVHLLILLFCFLARMYSYIYSHRILAAIPTKIRTNEIHIISAPECDIRVCVSWKLVQIMTKEANIPKKRASGPRSMPVIGEEAERERGVVSNGLCFVSLFVW